MGASGHEVGKLLGFLEQRKHDIESGVEDPKRIRDEWIKDLTQLMARLLEYLEPATSKRLLRVEPAKFMLREDKALGDYEAPGLVIVGPDDRKVSVMPRVRYAVGALGRVDLGSGTEAAMLVKQKSGWRVHWRDGSSDSPDGVELTADTFAFALQRLLS